MTSVLYAEGVSLHSPGSVAPPTAPWGKEHQLLLYTPKVLHNLLTTIRLCNPLRGNYTIVNFYPGCGRRGDRTLGFGM